MSTKNEIARRQVDHWFTYHLPTDAERMRLSDVRTAAKRFAHVILDNAPLSADRTAALRLLRECTMTVNAAIVVPPVAVWAAKSMAEPVVAKQEPVDDIVYYSDPSQKEAQWTNKSKSKDC